MSADGDDGSPIDTGQIMGEEPVRADVATRFKPGQVSNPRGRPKGSRNKLSEDFIAALYEDFIANGGGAIRKVREEMPQVYLKVVAGIVPKELKIEQQRCNVSDYTEAELMAIAFPDGRPSKGRLHRLPQAILLQPASI